MLFAVEAARADRAGRIIEELTDARNLRELTLYALKLTGNMDDAEDLISELIVTVYTDDAMSVAREPLAYCKTCMRNACINRARRESRVELVDPALLEEYGGAESFAALLDERETVNALRRALEEYPAELSEAFVKYHLEGYSVKELARRMGVKPNTLTRRFARMRKALRERAPLLWCIICIGLKGAV